MKTPTYRIGDIVQSYDFPHIDDADEFYMVGRITEIRGDMLVCATIRIVQLGKMVAFDEGHAFRTPKQGLGMLDERFPRVVMILAAPETADTADTADNT